MKYPRFLSSLTLPFLVIYCVVPVYSILLSCTPSFTSNDEFIDCVAKLDTKTFFFVGSKTTSSLDNFNVPEINGAQSSDLRITLVVNSDQFSLTIIDSLVEHVLSGTLTYNQAVLTYSSSGFFGTTTTNRLDGTCSLLVNSSSESAYLSTVITGTFSIDCAKGTIQYAMPQYKKGRLNFGFQEDR